MEGNVCFLSLVENRIRSSKGRAGSNQTIHIRKKVKEGESRYSIVLYKDEGGIGLCIIYRREQKKGVKTSPPKNERKINSRGLRGYTRREVVKNTKEGKG